MKGALADYWDRRSFLQPVNPSQWLERPETQFKLSRKPKGSKQSIRPVVPFRGRRVCGIEIPEAIANIGDAVEKSEYILQLPDDWDDEGSPPYQRETWERAVKFVLRNALELWRKERVRTEPPVVHNGPDGSIDIYWKSPNGNLLINVPSAPDQLATFYGFNRRTRTETKGALDTSASNEWLLMWITAK